MNGDRQHLLEALAEISERCHQGMEKLKTGEAPTGHYALRKSFELADDALRWAAEHDAEPTVVFTTIGHEQPEPLREVS